MELILIRHSMTRGNLQRRYVGITDEPLCPEGVELARSRAAIFPRVECLYVSPLVRCGQTADILYPGVPRTVCKDFRETDFGRFEYKNYEELKDDPDYQKWLDSGGTIGFPGGESMEEACERVLAAFDRMLHDLKEKNISTAAAIIHGGTIMAIMSGRIIPKRSFYDWQLKNCEGYLLLEHENCGLKLVREYRLA
ncbi:MAG: histidine phosphatase family protein [Clostridiales bacterium]|jgi:alpha-ribazole phosphatase|nr:histidine phosphatase family protein [Clostridiales bacterium]